MRRLARCEDCAEALLFEWSLGCVDERVQQDYAQAQERERQTALPRGFDPLPHVGADLFDLSERAERVGQLAMGAREQARIGNMFGESQGIACRPQRRGEIAILAQDAASEHQRSAPDRRFWRRRLEGREDLSGFAPPAVPAQRARQRHTALMLERLVAERRRRGHERAQGAFRVAKAQIVGPADRFEKASKDLALRGVICARRACGVLVCLRQGAARSHHCPELQPVSRGL